MEQPKIAGKAPIAVQLAAGEEVYWCACGLSKNQPFCDGSHSGTPFTPRPCRAEEASEVWLCTCKQTTNPPFCDGSHSKLADSSS